MTRYVKSPTFVQNVTNSNDAISLTGKNENTLLESIGKLILSDKSTKFTVRITGSYKLVEYNYDAPNFQ